MLTPRFKTINIIRLIIALIATVLLVIDQYYYIPIVPRNVDYYVMTIVFFFFFLMATWPLVFLARVYGSDFDSNFFEDMADQFMISSVLIMLTGIVMVISGLPMMMGGFIALGKYAGHLVEPDIVGGFLLKWGGCFVLIGIFFRVIYILFRYCAKRLKDAN